MQGFWLVAFVVQWLLVFILILLVVGILRYLHSVQERWDLAVPAISKYELQQRIDDFELPDVTGTLVKSQEIFSSSGTIIFFVSARCQSCSQLLAQIAELVTRPTLSLRKKLLLIVVGPIDSLREFLSEYPTLDTPLVTLLSDEKGATPTAFGVRSFPTGLEVDHKASLIDQTFNPHTEQWLYKVTRVLPPEEPVVQGRVAVSLPAALKHR